MNYFHFGYQFLLSHFHEYSYSDYCVDENFPLLLKTEDVEVETHR